MKCEDKIVNKRLEVDCYVAAGGLEMQLTRPVLANKIFKLSECANCDFKADVGRVNET